MTTAAAPTAADLPGAEGLLAQAGSENFTVASVVLGDDVRRHLMAIYGFARLVDDVGDEVSGDRLALLDVVESELDAAYDHGRMPVHPVMRNLAATIDARRLSDGPFRRLIEANRVDQTVTRYGSWDELMGYCSLSAAPVGELVLGVFGVATAERIALSDRVCAGLQVAEHLQDLAEDHARGRIYLPAEDLARFGCDPDALPDESNGPLRSLIAYEAGRARALLASGAPLARTLSPRPRIAVAGFVAGGRAALDGIVAPGATSRRRALLRWLPRSLAGR